MSEIKATFIGSGDAFGSGGRLQTCILFDTPHARIAIDFGATSLIGLRQQNIDPNSVDAILLTHLHGDHCGGAPFLLMDAMLGSKRSTPLTIVGPTGTDTHVPHLQEALFPGSHVMVPRFDLQYREIEPGGCQDIFGMELTAISARHTTETNPMAFRLQIGDQSVAYTGDGELTDELMALVSGVDLLVAECYFFSKAVKWHLNYPDIAHLSAKNVVLTHMHSDMLAHIDEVPETCAYDGFSITI